MTKLGTIKRELETNPNVFIASVDEFPPATYPNGSSGLHEPYCVDFHVAPINEMYLPDELNRFMSGLVSVEPERKRPFSLWRDFEPSQGRGWDKHTYRLRLGWMYFVEKIGQEIIAGETIIRVISRNLEIEDLEKLIRKVMPNEELRGVDINICRAIGVKVYPNIEIAKKKFGGNDLGAEMTQYHIQEFVPNIKPIYELFEKTYADRKRDPTPMETIGSNIRPICEVKVQ